MKNSTRVLQSAAIAAAALLLSLPQGTCFPLQDPPSQEDEDPKVDRLILRLGSDLPEDREGAMAELRKIGAGAVPHLKRALKDSPEAEMLARIESLLSELDLPDPRTFFSGRRGGRENPGAPESAVVAALQWLARHQNPDGSWGAEGFSKQCSGTKCSGAGERDYDVGVTGLALLAFLGAGYDQDSPDESPDPLKPDRVLKFGEVLRSGLKWLISRQDREGCLGERSMKYNYCHAVATQALAEAYGMSRAEFLKIPARKAADFLMAGQNPGKGWRYSSKCGDNDSSVTACSVLALKSAQASTLGIPKTAYEGAIAWFDEATETNGYYQVGYNARSTGKVYVPGKNEQFDHHPAMSAAGMTARMFIQRKRTAPELGAVNLLMADLPEWKTNKIDFYYWYFGSLALFHVDGPEGPMWKRWNLAMTDALLPNQKTGKEACEHGSWDPSVDRWGSEGGRVSVTAMNALTLEVTHRYPVVFNLK
jgi:hypothetical protein